VARFWIGIGALFSVTVLVALGLWAVAPVVWPGWEPTAVTSGSMGPRIAPGDIVLVSSSDGRDLGRGTVIRFSRAGGAPMLHRVDGRRHGRYVTRGDANPTADAELVSTWEVDGVGRLLVPYVGFPSLWIDRGNWLAAGSAVAALIALVWAARWAVLDAFDPWRRAS
jgi:signal peptidase